MFRYFPWSRYLTEAAPLLTPYVSGDFGLLIREMNIEIPGRVRQAECDRKYGLLRERPPVFSDILASSLPEHEKNRERLSGEVSSLMGARTETTSARRLHRAAGSALTIFVNSGHWPSSRITLSLDLGNKRDSAKSSMKWILKA
jgi:hypothetical protein